MWEDAQQILAQGHKMIESSEGTEAGKWLEELYCFVSVSRSVV